MNATIPRPLALPNLPDRDQYLSAGAILSDGRDGFFLGFGSQSRSATPSTSGLNLFAPGFFLYDSEPWVHFEEVVHVSGAALTEWLTLESDRDRVLGEVLTLPMRWIPTPMADFAQRFAGVMHLIERGELQKAVPIAARFSRDIVSPRRVRSMLVAAIKYAHQQPLHIYGWWQAGSGILGVTPETLFEIPAGGKTLHTMALAGTRRPGNATILADRKERLEHQVVVDSIVQRLLPLADVRTGPVSEVELPNLVHLQTPIEAIPHTPVTFDRWVHALHPTPAVGAWPMARGQAWLDEQERELPRGRHGAPFGFIDPQDGSARCLVAIRNVQWTPQEARMIAGCGVVRGSQLENEWREVNAKIESIRAALAL